MSLDAAQIEALAGALWRARLENQAIAPLTESHPTLTLQDAYRISRHNCERRVTQGDKLVGRKVGLTSLAVQKQLSVAEPDFGYLHSGMAVKDGGTLPAASLLQGKVEGEVAFVLARDLKGPGLKSEDVLAATDHVLVCIEIIDSRVRDWKIKIQDTVADNASSAFFVLGGERVKPEKIDLRMAGMCLRKNGEVESTGVGAACLGHPLNAVAWLANTLGNFGETLTAGDIILSGAYGPVVPFNPGDHCEVEINGLGRVSCHYGK